jgi:hypothetical protein
MRDQQAGAPLDTLLAVPAIAAVCSLLPQPRPHPPPAAQHTLPPPAAAAAGQLTHQLGFSMPQAMAKTRRKRGVVDLHMT